MLLHEVNVMEGLVQGVVAEQPVPRYEKKAGNGKAGEDLEQQEQVQPGGSRSTMMFRFGIKNLLKFEEMQIMLIILMIIVPLIVELVKAQKK